jgi:imidazolonepropionase-like amidohydrolase
MWGTPGMQKLALTNARIIDCTGSDPLEKGAVVIAEGRIKKVVGGTLERLPDDAIRIDCQNHTLLPGLIDAHVHMGSVDPTFTEQQRKYFTSYLNIKSINIIKETLDQGFTTVRDVGGADPGFRQAIAEGLIPGPRLFVCGRMLSQTGGHADGRLPTETYQPIEHTAGTMSGVYDGVDAVRRASREQLRQGVDHLKVMAGGGAMSPADEIDTAQYSIDELKAIVFEAENGGKYVAAHCYSDRSIKNCIQAGVRTIEHGNLMTESSADAIREAGAYLVPTMITYEMISKLGASFGVPENNIRKINQAREKAAASLEIAFKAGVKIGSGSDLLGPMQIYKGGELELQAKVMGPMGAILAATKTNSEIIRQQDNLGTIEPGKLADLILVKGDPLKDISLFKEYESNILLIIQAGKIYKNIL